MSLSRTLLQPGGQTKRLAGYNLGDQHPATRLDNCAKVLRRMTLRESESLFRLFRLLPLSRLDDTIQKVIYCRNSVRRLGTAIMITKPIDRRFEPTIPTD